MTVWIYSDEDARFVYDESDSIPDAIARYLTAFGGNAAPIVAAMVVGNDDDGPEVMAAIDIVGRTERYSVKDNERGDWVA